MLRQIPPEEAEESFNNDEFDYRETTIRGVDEVDEFFVTL